MSPALFVSLPFVLLLLISKGVSSDAPKPAAPPIEKVIDDLLSGPDDEIIIVCKKKRQC